MNNIRYLLLLLATTLSAQVRLRYLDLGLQPTPCCMTTDAEGNAYVAAGYVTSETPSVTNKVVVYRINPANGTIYRLIFGGSANDTPTSVAVDANGNVFVAGTTNSIDFPLVQPIMSHGPLSSTNGDARGFLSKIDPSGKLVFSTFVGGVSQEYTQVGGLTVDSAGDVYLTGSSNAADFPLTEGAYQKTGNAFVMKISNAGDRMTFSTFIGSGGGGLAIAVDSHGEITVGGLAQSAGFPATPGAFQTTCGCFDSHSGDPFGGQTTIYAASFVLRLSADGSRVLWSTYLGGSGDGLMESQDTVQAMALTSDGGVVVAGTAMSPDFPVTPGAFQTKNRAVLGAGTPANLFVTRLNATGTGLKYSTFLGGAVEEQFAGLQLDAQENPWVTGTTDSPDFPLVPHSLNLGNEFVAELSADGSKLLSTRMYPYEAAGAAFTMDASGGATLLGSAGSLIRIPEGALSKISMLAQMNAEAYMPSQRVAPGEAITLIGTGLGPLHGVSAQPDSTGKYPTKLDDVQVMCDGIPAPLLFVSTHQINAVVPFEVSGKTSILLRVNSGNKSTTPLKLLVVPAYPEIFAAAAGIPGAFPPPNPVVRNQDGSLNSTSNPAKPGSKITFWVNGAGLFTTTFADGVIIQTSTAVPVLPVSVVYADLLSTQVIPSVYGAAPGQVAGVLEVTATLPQTFPQNWNYAQVQLQVGDFESDAATIVLQ